MKFTSLLLLLFSPLFLIAQNFSRQDTLRGTLTPERSWWDVHYYDLDISVNPSDSTISGSNTIYFEAKYIGSKMQIDLQEPMSISKITQGRKKLSFTREGNAFFVSLTKPVAQGSIESIRIEYSGKPIVAKNAPWDGGLIWKTDTLGNPWVGTAVQGEGASMFWPLKDHQSDEPDSMRIAVTVPKGLTNISNGRLRSTKERRKSTTWEWFVANPINSYNVTLNVGNYVHFSDSFQGEKGALDVDYWVLSYNEEIAKTQFAETIDMLKIFEFWFGPFPWYSDGFKMVESHYLGMEHQSAIAYGNGFANGYRGRDLSGSGWGLKFDFIIIHEAGHEWFGNNITTADIADMWVHEGFTNYSEALYVEGRWGKRAGEEYAIGLRQNIRNDKPIIGPYGVNRGGSGDMYFKGSAMLHTLRQLVEDDEKFRQALRGLNTEFGHKITTSEQVENYLSEFFDIDLTQFFDQYLRTTMVPTLETRFESDSLHFRYTHIVDGFDMPVRVRTQFLGWTWIYPTKEWKSVPFELSRQEDFKVDENFYVKVKTAD